MCCCISAFICTVNGLAIVTIGAATMAVAVIIEIDFLMVSYIVFAIVDCGDGPGFRRLDDVFAVLM